jgi:Zn-finger nucleic acid-binding protein
MTDEKDRLGNRLHQIELAREDLWAHRHDEQILKELRRKYATILACPRCKSALTDIGISISIRAATCPNGHGAWLDRRAVEQIRVQLATAAAIHRETLGEKLFGEIILYMRHRHPGSIECPECGARLAIEAAISPGAWTLTAMACPKGHGAWVSQDMLAEVRTRFGNAVAMY